MLSQRRLNGEAKSFIPHSQCRSADKNSMLPLTSHGQSVFQTLHMPRNIVPPSNAVQHTATAVPTSNPVAWVSLGNWMFDSVVPVFQGIVVRDEPPSLQQHQQILSAQPSTRGQTATKGVGETEPSMAETRDSDTLRSVSSVSGSTGRVSPSLSTESFLQALADFVRSTVVPLMWTPTGAAPTETQNHIHSVPFHPEPGLTLHIYTYHCPDCTLDPIAWQIPERAPDIRISEAPFVPPGSISHTIWAITGIKTEAVLSSTTFDGSALLWLKSKDDAERLIAELSNKLWLLPLTQLGVAILPDPDSHQFCCGVLQPPIAAEHFHL